jgi:Outer membrane lipoprotein carrier protein LolA-like
MRIKRTCERRGGRFLLIAAAALLFAMPNLSAVSRAALDPDALLKRIAVTEARDVPFEERRFVGAVTEPLVSRGTLRFEPPDRLIKKTESPHRETATVDADSLSVENADGVETTHIDLWVSADLRLVFDSLRAVLRGDAGALRALFDIAVTGDEAAWTMTLTPKEASEATRIERIVVSGGPARIGSFDIVDADGGRSLIQMLDTPARP